MNRLLKQMMEKGTMLTVQHSCGCVVEWLLVLEETTLAEVKADLEATTCRRCRKIVEVDP
jgi:hypothetical protein